MFNFKKRKNIDTTKEASLFGEMGDKKFLDTLESLNENSRETEWTLYLAEGNLNPKFIGEAEFRLNDGSRVDILTDEYAFEVEWVYKWKEAIGQALYYSALTGKKPAIILLAKKQSNEKLNYSRLMIVCAKYDIKVFVINTKDPK